MLRLYPVEPNLDLVAEPPDLLARLTARGVRLLDSRRWLVAEVPASAVSRPDWGLLDKELREWAPALQLIAGEVQSSRSEIPPLRLIERMLSLPAEALPTLLETLGGPEAAFRWPLETKTQAHVDLLYAAFLRALASVLDSLPSDDMETELDELDELDDFDDFEKWPS